MFETRKAWNGWFCDKNISGCKEKILRRNFNTEIVFAYSCVSEHSEHF